MRRARWVDARFGSLSPTRTDAALVAVLCLAWVVEVLGNGSRPAPLAATLFAGWAMIAPVAWRRRVPAAALAAHGALMGLSAALGAGVLDGPHNVEGISIAILIYSLGAYAHGVWLAAGVVLSLAIVTSHALLVGTPFGPGTALSLVAFVAAATLTGRALRQRRLLTRELEERAARLRADREARARSVADEERRRIAHELHDVVTHVLGAMVVQATSLRRARPSEPAEIARTLGEIERSGRQALAEMRLLLSVLRAGEGQPLAPAPTIDQVHRLAALTRERGLPVELRIEGRPRPLARSIDISAYRVVEDALQASLERGEGRALVTLRYGPSDTEVEVTGEHPARPSPGEAARLRLAAIRERVAICAGELKTGEGAGGGFAVRARFPHNGHAAVSSAGERPASTAEAGLPPARRRNRRGWLVDAALAVAVLAALTLDAFSSGELRGSGALNEAVFVVMASAFAWRRRAPLAAAATVAITAVALTAFLTPLPALQTGQGALVLMTYLAAMTSQGRQAAFAFATLAASVAAVMFVYGVPELSSREVFALATLTVLAWLAGRATRTRALLNRALGEKAEALERDREERARAAAGEVRRRIARELHDVVAHSLTVMIVQAGSARRIADSDIAEALRAAELIEATGREALAEMRRLLAVMGDERDGSPRAAPPGIDSLDALIERSRAAGLPVELRRDGDARPLPAGIDIAAYRVVQEALTNTMKHAGASRAELVVHYRADSLELLMTDDGHGPDGHLNGTGHGLVGMRERVGVYGGELETGRADGGGFRVRARFPLETRA